MPLSRLHAPLTGLLASLLGVWLAGCAAPVPSVPEAQAVEPQASTHSAPALRPLRPPRPGGAALQDGGVELLPVPGRPAEPALRLPEPGSTTEGSGEPALRLPEPPAEPPEPAVLLGSGIASWYADSLHGRFTANGERYDRAEFTAAHRSLPFGSRLCVRSLVNGRTVAVRVNDRGPFAPGRVIDLSRAAAEELGLMGLGIKPVELWQMGEEDEVCPEDLEPATAGERLGLDGAAAAKALQRPAAAARPAPPRGKARAKARGRQGRR
ncbi:septal ring lytic transglycosylase RlpA family protein [Melaminivora sp.]|uniref:septal ring lytic transglycosylase RlpA family protein n=1 Tax=Melaminivora sp. TaxID=1933032 RepID=UPI0028A7BF70|nr:septal ring lytic transglycosylase RlpA family protein [Melaminivora sp.]